MGRHGTGNKDAMLTILHLPFGSRVTPAASPHFAFRCDVSLAWYLTLNTFLSKQPSPMSMSILNQPSNCKPQNLEHLYYFGQRHITENTTSLDLSIYNCISIYFILKKKHQILNFFSISLSIIIVYVYDPCIYIVKRLITFFVTLT